MQLSSQFLVRLRSKLKTNRLAVILWGLRRKAVWQYYILRLIGHVSYCIIGRRAALRGYYAKTRDFLRHGNGQFIGLDPLADINEHVVSDEPKPEIFVAVLPNATSLSEGAIISFDHRLLADVSWGGRVAISQPLENPAMHRLCLPPVEYTKGKIAIITSIMAENYYHWLFDILPRFDILERSALIPDHYYVNATAGFQIDSLKALGIPSDKILDPAIKTHITADELIIPSLPGPVFSLTPQLRSCTYLRSAFLPKNTARKGHRAIYITRSDAAIRRVVNEAEIQEEVLERGFEVVSLRNVTFSQQVELFSEAAIIVGPHGAGFSNAVFSPPGCTLIEFMPEGYAVDCFERLARLLKFKYHSIIGKKYSGPDHDAASYDQIVDRVALRRLISQIA